MTEPFCTKCSKTMDCYKVGAAVVTMARNEEGEKFPLTLRWGDIYKCPSCGNEVITNFGSSNSNAAEVEANVKNLSSFFEEDVS